MKFIDSFAPCLGCAPPSKTVNFLIPHSKIDKLRTNVISQQEFRAVITSRFNVEMSDEEYTMFVDRLPLDEEGNVKYAEFMADFDTR